MLALAVAVTADLDRAGSSPVIAAGTRFPDSARRRPVRHYLLYYHVIPFNLKTCWPGAHWCLRRLNR